jgi:hypothetical protein
MVVSSYALMIAPPDGRWRREVGHGTPVVTPIARGTKDLRPRRRTWRISTGTWRISTASTSAGSILLVEELHDAPQLARVISDEHQPHPP